ncbi:MAG: PilZ domain-containing protein [Pseudobdellovibrionaceae bacterium]
MKNQIFIIGKTTIPDQLKNDQSFDCHLIENPFDLLQGRLLNTPEEKLLIVYCPFLEVRHLDIYSYLQKRSQNLKSFFIVEELSVSIITRLKEKNEFIVLWKTEKLNINEEIYNYLRGKRIELRQDRRESCNKKGLLTPTTLSYNHCNSAQTIAVTFDNISINGFCINIKSKIYEVKKFINLTYQNKQGDFITIVGQIRWNHWSKSQKIQKLGIQLLAQI